MSEGGGRITFEPVAWPDGMGIATRLPFQATAASLEFASLYETEMPKLMRFVMKHGASPIEAADAAQAAFSAAWEAWEDIREPSAWLRTVAIREHLRRPLKETPVDDLPDEVGTSSVLDTIELGEQEEKVMSALATLPMKQRQVMAWHYDGFSHTQIAGQMKITEDAVRQNLHRARARLKALLLGTSEEGGAK
jgi:RNA polymerase sigma-70 factor (ECF subfamily)